MLFRSASPASRDEVHFTEVASGTLIWTVNVAPGTWTSIEGRPQVAADDPAAALLDAETTVVARQRLVTGAALTGIELWREPTGP